MSAGAIPQQFTGYAAMAKQDALAFKLEKYTYTPRAFTEDDIVIKIDCCGVCGTDVHTLTCGWRAHDNFPAIVGHEIVGRVVRAGQHSGHSVGDRVGFGAHCGSCGICVNCTSEMENYCLNGTVGTYQGKTGDSVQGYTQGGYADYYLASGRFAVPIPPEMGSEEAAPLLCAGVTVYAPLKRYASPGSKVGVIGIGGLGHLGLQFAKALGAEVWAISHSRDKAEDVRALGAVGFINSNDAASLAAHRNTFDLLLCTSYAPHLQHSVQTLYLPLLRPHTHLVLLGIPDSGIPSGGWPLLGKSITGSLIGSPSEIREMFAFATRHGVRALVERRGMGDAEGALKDLHEGRARYRYVLVNEGE